MPRFDSGSTAVASTDGVDVAAAAAFEEFRPGLELGVGVQRRLLDADGRAGTYLHAPVSHLLWARGVAGPLHPIGVLSPLES